MVRLNEIEPAGRQLVLFTLCLVWAGDMLAYFVGRSFGRVPMAPALSPKKTWEGAFANLVASLLVSSVCPVDAGESGGAVRNRGAREYRGADGRLN